MKPMNPNDQMFLLLENRSQPMHVAGLLLFKIPDGASDTFVRDTIAHWRTFTQPAHKFGQTVVSKRGRWFWKDDSEFDLDNHLIHVSLPKPARIRELLSYVSIQHSSVMDRSIPLWRVHVIEGIEGNRFAIYFKIHHCMTDGVNAMRMLNESLSKTPEEMNATPAWAREEPKRDRPKDAASRIRRSLKAVRSGVQDAATILPVIGVEMMRAVANLPFSAMTRLSDAPRCDLSKEITSGRRFVAQSYEMDRFVKIKNEPDTTINDVLMTVLGGAVRSYFINHGELPTKSLVAMVPVSVRTQAESTGNAIACVLSRLATQVADPLERLSIVSSNMTAAKQFVRRVGTVASTAYMNLLTVPAVVYGLTGAKPPISPANLLISNVPGESEPLYINGALLDGIYPLSLVTFGMGLNVTILSYNQQLHIGFTGCRQTIPKLQRLIDYTEDSLKELEEVLGLSGVEDPMGGELGEGGESERGVSGVA